MSEMVELTKQQRAIVEGNRTAHCCGCICGSRKNKMYYRESRGGSRRAFPAREIVNSLLYKRAAEEISERLDNPAVYFPLAQFTLLQIILRSRRY